MQAPAKEEEKLPFRPVFEVAEDLIINFTFRGTNTLFDSVIASYKDGSYPALPKPEIAEEGDVAEPVSPVLSLTAENLYPAPLSPVSNIAAEKDGVDVSKRHSYDPYENHSYPPDLEKPSLPKEVVQADSVDPLTEHPTSGATPPPPSADLTDKFVDFVPLSSGTAIGIQNSLRQVLSVQFPTAEGYSQYLYTAPPEMDRLWKPIFRHDETASISKEGRTVDQIIALGSEEGVHHDFVAQISGQIERLGSKKDGVNRSGKIDIRYVYQLMVHALKLTLLLGI